MLPPRNQAHVMPMALLFSALISLGLAVAFWTALIDVGEVRLLVTGVLGLVAAMEVALGLYFYSRSRS